MRSRFAAALFAAVPLLVLGCGGGGNPIAPPPPPPPPPSPVASVVVTPGADTLTSLGQTRQLTAVAKDASGNTIAGKTFAWTSTPPGTVTVDAATGLATASANGQATITASVDGKSGSAALLVDQQVNTVEVTPPTVSTAVIGTVQQFGAVAKDAGGTPIASVKFLWVSSDPAVASVDSTGKVTARAPGVATITAAARGVPANAVFTVTQAATQLAITIQPTASTEGQQLPGSVQIEIHDAAGALVTGARNAVTLSIGTNPGGGTLGGATTVSAVGGIATFNGLDIDRAGVGYTLVASATDLAPATTTAFTVFLDFVSVSAGNLTTCGITASGPAYCWGANTGGTIGDGTTTNRFRPTRVLSPPGVRFRSISIGTLAIVCANSTAGAVYCWGTGNLGVAAPAQSLTPILAALPPGVTFASIAVGGGGACGATPGGALYCWGSNGNHQVGDGTTTPRPTPVPAIAPAGVLFSAVSASGIANCATSSGGAGYCWGANATGQVGNGTTTEPTGPAPVTMPSGVNFSSVSTGNNFSCGVGFSGVIYCWGANVTGQLGDGTTAPHLLPAPVAAPAGLTFIQVFATANGTGGIACGLATTGIPYCWGDNPQGVLGDGTTTGHNTPQPVTMPDGVTFVDISGSNTHVCGVTSRGAVYCWGANSIGELGDNTGTPHLTPVRVAR